MTKIKIKEPLDKETQEYIHFLQDRVYKLESQSIRSEMNALNAKNELMRIYHNCVLDGKLMYPIREIVPMEQPTSIWDDFKKVFKSGK